MFVCVVAPGFFLPLEQEVGRAVADRRVRGVGGGPVVKKAAFAGSVLTGSLIVLTLLLAAFTPLVDRLFHGQEVLVACFVIALITYAIQHITRGTLSGNGRFGPYGDPRRRGLLLGWCRSSCSTSPASTTSSGTAASRSHPLSPPSIA
jgi:hypothetical protein